MAAQKGSAVLIKATVSGSMLAIITETFESIFVKAKKIRPR